MENLLIKTIVLCLVSAAAFGFLAKKLKLPTIVGYLVAGIAVGPFTPGLMADVDTAKQLAEVGIILLMFGVGLHFSPRDLMAVHRIAVPGALLQMFASFFMCMLLLISVGVAPLAAGLFGFSISVASTVVMLRAIEHRGEMQTLPGKIAVGWLIVEDLAVVIAIVLLPVLTDIVEHRQEIGLLAIASELGIILVKVGCFAALMMFAGKRLLPWMLRHVAKTGSRELGALATLAMALGFAYIAYTVFDASFALGAFLAGLVLNESGIGHKAAEQSLPLRDTFAVLFFVSVGMLFNPEILIDEPFMVVMTLVVIIIGKALACYGIMRMFKQEAYASAVIAVSLAQIGEFSFIFAGLALENNMISEQVYSLVLAGALLSIAINPFLFKALDRYLPRPAEPALAAA